MNIFNNLPALLSFTKQVSNSSTQSRDFRDEAREPLTAPATIIPVSSELVPTDEPIDVVTWDISAKGVAVILDGKPQHEFYAVQIPIGVEQHFLLGSVCWCDERGPFTFVGLEVIKVLDSLPS